MWAMKRVLFALLVSVLVVGAFMPAVVEGARKQLADNQARRDEIRRLLAAL